MEEYICPFCFKRLKMVNHFGLYYFICPENQLTGDHVFKFGSFATEQILKRKWKESKK